MNHLKNLIREVPDFPKPGILFYDITTLLKDADGLRELIDRLGAGYGSQGNREGDRHRGRGDLLPRRRLPTRSKPGSCRCASRKSFPPRPSASNINSEYGTDALEIHRDAIEPGENVLIVDDVLATGGTASAVTKLVENLGGKVAGLGFAIELDFLNGRAKLDGYHIRALLHY